MAERLCIVGLDEPEYAEIRERLEVPVIAHETLPPLKVQNGKLLVEREESVRFSPVSRVVFHGIFEDDLDFIAALALWGGPCLPSARAMMDCRLKLPCLVRALGYTRFGELQRGYAAPGTTFRCDSEMVAKWGNWHCGENKVRFCGSRQIDQASIVEPFIFGQAVRVVLIGNESWQIRLEGDDWRKSIHHETAALTAIDPELLEDTRRVQDGFGLELIANDYMIADDGTKHLLEVNHMPNVTRFPEIWEAYREFVVEWIRRAS